ncbi:unnamed protein product [Ectocarpus fasciculatus]
MSHIILLTSEISLFSFSPLTRVSPPAEDQATVAQREKKKADHDRIVALFNSVMLADGLKVLKHHRRLREATSRVIRFAPNYGGALVWYKPDHQQGTKNNRVPLDVITQVQLKAGILWISAGDERVGFETSRPEEADLLYKAICILVHRCRARVPKKSPDRSFECKP